MKIALVCTEMLPVPPVAGGAIQQYIEGVLPHLAKHHEIKVYGKRYSGLSDYESANGIQYVRLPASNPGEYLNHLKNSMDKDFHLIYVFNRPNWVLELGETFPDSKFALSLHNEMFDSKKLTPETAVKCIERVEFINTVSKFIADGIKKLYSEAGEKLKTVYSAADPDKYAAAWSEQGALNKYRIKRNYNIENYKVILYVGRMNEKKGPHILLRGVKSLMNNRNDVALFMVGSRWYGENDIDNFTKALHAMAKELPGPVIFTGFLVPEEIRAIYNAADIFVCPSQWNEPLARVHYEAMASGLPIITTGRGGNAEVISGHGNGIVIDDYTNPEQFACHINYLLNNPQLANEMGRAGRHLVEDYFNWKRVSEEILTELENVS